MPTRSLPRADFNPRLVVLAYPGLSAFEYGCVTEVFGLLRPEIPPPWYTLETASVSGRGVRASFGLRLAVDGGLERLRGAGTVVLPGWPWHSVPKIPTRLRDALRAAHASGTRLLSICSGAFVLAATGLLDGREITTHWRYAEALQQRFPGVRVRADVLYVDQGALLSSAGSAAGLDLCLHLVRRDFGAATANLVARRLVIPPHREGGQAQYIERPLPAVARDALAPLLDHLRARLSEAWPLARMAACAHSSARTLVRRFHAATGLPPGEWLLRERVALARELLERPFPLPLEQLALRCGLGTPSTLRHHFQRLLGLSPVAYRSRFADVGGR